MLQKYLPVIGGAVMIAAGAAFLFANMMNQTMYTVLPGLGVIIAGVGVIVWKLPDGR